MRPHSIKSRTHMRRVAGLYRKPFRLLLLCSDLMLRSMSSSMARSGLPTRVVCVCERPGACLWRHASPHEHARTQGECAVNAFL